jgi:hypothetical protein
LLWLQCVDVVVSLSENQLVANACSVHARVFDRDQCEKDVHLCLPTSHLHRAQAAHRRCSRPPQEHWQHRHHGHRASCTQVNKPSINYFYAKNLLNHARTRKRLGVSSGIVSPPSHGRREKQWAFRVSGVAALTAPERRRVGVPSITNDRSLKATVCRVAGV